MEILIGELDFYSLTPLVDSVPCAWFCSIEGKEAPSRSSLSPNGTHIAGAETLPNSRALAQHQE